METQKTGRPDLATLLAFGLERKRTKAPTPSQAELNELGRLMSEMTQQVDDMSPEDRTLLGQLIGCTVGSVQGLIHKLVNR